MSDTQTVWTILWRRTLKSLEARHPFEIAEVVPDVAEALKVIGQGGRPASSAA